MVNVGEYTIHGSYGHVYLPTFQLMFMVHVGEPYMDPMS